MDEISIRERISKRKLRELEQYIDIVENIREHGRKTKELVLQYLPDDISHVPDRVRELFNEFLKKKEKSLNELIIMYKNVPRIEIATRYVIFCLCTTASLKDMRVERYFATLRELYSEILPFIENPEYSDVDRIVKLIETKYEKVDNQFLTVLTLKYAHGVRKVLKAFKKDVFEWIMTLQTIREFEENLRVFFMKKSSERIRKCIRSIIRVFSHRTSFPLAVNIIRKGEYRKYVSIADMYTTLTTFRSGAFLIMKLDSEKVRKIEAELKSGKEVIIRVESVKGIVRSVAKLSLDPILYERGAFDIGYRYCSKNKCEECPISNICLKYLNIKIK